MKRIQSQEEIERKRQRNAKILTVFMLGILVFSSVAYAFFSIIGGISPGVVPSSNGEVQQVGSSWVFQFGDRTQSVQYSPEEVKDVKGIVTYTISGLAGKNVYYDIKNDGIANEIGANIIQYTSKFQPACYGKCESDLPEKDCSEILIVWRESNKQEIREEDKCIFIDGDLKTADAFVYKIFGITIPV